MDARRRVQMLDMFTGDSHPDQAWNMISLSPALRKAWGRAFALKWAGIDVDAIDDGPLYSTVLLEWYWLPRCDISPAVEAHYVPGEDMACRRGLDPNAPGALDDIARSLRDVVAQVQVTEPDEPADSPGYLDHVTQWLKGLVTNDTSTTLRAMTDSKGRPIKNGHGISVRVLTEHMEKTRHVIEAQWIVARTAALSGAAQVADCLDREAPSTPRVYLPPIPGFPY